MNLTPDASQNQDSIADTKIIHDPASVLKIMHGEKMQLLCHLVNEAYNIQELKNLTNTVNNLVTDEFARIGLVNEDGKIEVGFDHKRRLMLVDVLGTLDECRFTFNGLSVSKEIARIYYRNTDWYQAVEEAKKKDRQNWKKICRLHPEPLPSKLTLLISQIYCACTNEITQNEWFKDIPQLKNILEEIREILLEKNVPL